MKKLILLLAITFLTSCNQHKTDNLNSDYVDTLLNPIDTTIVTPESLKPKIDSLKIKELSKYFSVKTDEFDVDKVKWIIPMSAPKFTNRNALYCYFAKIGDDVSNFRFKLQYTSDDWLFIERCEFLVDDKPFTFVPSEVKRDNNQDIWEWFDEQVDYTNIDLILALANAKKAKVKLVGTNYHKIVEISQSQILNIKRTYDYYIASGGSFSSTY